MTDKVQKIKEFLIGIACAACCDAKTKKHIENIILPFIDSLQEEPVSEDKMTIRKEWFEHCRKSWYNEGYIDGTHNRDRQFENSVSDDVNKAAEQDVCEVINTCSATGIPNDHIPSWVQDAMINEFIHGAKWKAGQFEKERLKQCDTLTKYQAQIESDFVTQHLKNNNRTPTFIDAIEYGMRLQKAQMMAKAIDGEVGYWNLRGLSVNVKLPRSVKEGDKVKVLVVKED